MRTLELAAALATSLCLANPAPDLDPAQAGQPGPAPDHFSMPSGPLTIHTRGDEVDSMFDVLHELSRSAGQHFSVSDITRASLEGLSPGLLGDAEIPAEQAYSFVSALLFRHGYLMSELKGTEPSLLAVYSRNQRGQDGGLSWTRVSEDQLEWYRDYPAFLIETVVTFEYLEVRQVTTSLRALITDNHTQSMLNVGNSNSIVFRGTAANVADMVLMMKSANEDSGELFRKRAEELAKQPPTPAPEDPPSAKDQKGE
jgi:hypothetical protein